MLKQNIQQLLQRPVTRREFLRDVGLLCIGFIGLNNVLHTLNGPSSVVHHHYHVSPAQPRGFGGGKFGV